MTASNGLLDTVGAYASAAAAAGAVGLSCPTVDGALSSCLKESR